MKFLGSFFVCFISITALAQDRLVVMGSGANFYINRVSSGSIPLKSFAIQYDVPVAVLAQYNAFSVNATIEKGDLIKIPLTKNNFVQKLIENEIEKLAVNLGARKGITEDDIENYIGISKEFNVFELQDAIAKKDLAKAIRIIGYFESNPKAAPIVLILPAIYNFFSKVFMIYGMANTDDRSVATELGVNPYFVKDYTNAARKYAYEGVERIMLLLHEYNLRSVGVNDGGSSDAGLLKEMVVKMMQ
jgi:LysM repeat protein